MTPTNPDEGYSDKNTCKNVFIAIFYINKNSSFNTYK